MEYSNNYSKTSGSVNNTIELEPALTNDDTITNFHASNSSASFNFKQNITG